METPRLLRVALDWTPNSNHSGFYVAQAQGFYAAEGITVEIVPPSDKYDKEETPARMVVNGRADLCVAPTESVLSCWTSDHPASTRPRCVATLLQRNTSAIVALKSNAAIKCAADLAGKLYASYEGRFEMAIVNELITQGGGGGGGGAVEVLPPKLDCFDHVLDGRCDATWVFMGWEGLQRKDVELTAFSLEEHAVPYGYSPCLLAASRFTSAEAQPEDQAVLRAFLRATARGYELAHKDPQLAADALFDGANHPSLHALGRAFVLEAQQYLSQGGDGCLLLDAATNKWGVMDAGRWEAFVKFLLEKRLLGDAHDKAAGLDVAQLFTNEFL